MPARVGAVFQLKAIYLMEPILGSRSMSAMICTPSLYRRSNFISVPPSRGVRYHVQLYTQISLWLSSCADCSDCHLAFTLFTGGCCFQTLLKLSTISACVMLTERGRCCLSGLSSVLSHDEMTWSSPELDIADHLRCFWNLKILLANAWWWKCLVWYVIRCNCWDACGADESW